MWIDTTYDADRMKPRKVGYLSDDYFALVAARSEWGAYLGLGERVLVVLDGVAYQVVTEGEGERIELPTPRATATPRATRPPASTRVPTATPAPGGNPTPENGGQIICRGAPVAVLLALLAAFWFTRRG